MTNQGRVLIVEDDVDMRNLLKNSLEYEGFRCDDAATPSDLKKYLDYFQYNVILMDLQLGTENSLELIPYVVQKAPQSAVIVMTAYGSIDTAVDSMERGATTFIAKASGIDRIISDVKKRFAAAPLTEKVRGEKLGIVGESPRMREVLEQIEQIKDVDATVLIFGESGTGKELIARGIHKLSRRQSQPFEAINCGAIPDALLESELFGHVKGSFTDAKQDRKGCFEICSEGTLFLDEIGEMPLNLQVKLLRAIQEKEIKPVGGSQVRKVNTRIVCATNKNLEDEIAQGHFREDLYFRLSIFPIELPPLRERPEDIPHLVQHFLALMNHRYSKSVAPPSKMLLAKICAFNWPGNIRQLQNALERAVVLSRDGEINPEHLSMKPQREDAFKLKQAPESVVYKEAKEVFEKDFLIRILSLTKGNVSEASRISGRFRSDIYRLMEKYGINKKNYDLHE